MSLSVIVCVIHPNDEMVIADYNHSKTWFNFWCSAIPGINCKIWYINLLLAAYYNQDPSFVASKDRKLKHVDEEFMHKRGLITWILLNLMVIITQRKIHKMLFKICPNRRYFYRFIYHIVFDADHGYIPFPPVSYCK